MSYIRTSLFLALFIFWLGECTTSTPVKPTSSTAVNGNETLHEERSSNNANETSKLHIELSELLSNGTSEAQLLKGVKHILKRRNIASCFPASFDELHHNWSTVAASLKGVGKTQVMIWSVNVKSDNLQATEVSFGATKDLLKVLYTDPVAGNKNCIDVRLDEDKNRFPNFLLSATPNLIDCEMSDLYSCNEVQIITLRLNTTSCQDDMKEKWFYKSIPMMNCRLNG